MKVNVGLADRAVRVVIGLALLWYAVLAPVSGYNWVGWLGVPVLLSALFGFCPLYALLGLNTSPRRGR